MLSREQETCVRHGAGPAMVLAGPGSGKTLVITHRIHRLILDGVRPEHILVITFTRAAAVQMRERFLHLTKPRHYPVTFGTFHAVFFQILKHSYRYTADSILQGEEQDRMLLQIAQELKIDCGDRHEWTETMRAELSRVSTEQIPLDCYYSTACPEEEFRAVCRLYTARKREAGRIDFDDMCTRTLELLLSRPDVLRSWQERFTHILVDEFQDINPLQYRIVRMLAGPEDNLFIVGDDDQSIYRFRGSRPEIMLHFPQDYPGCAVYKLNENYRATVPLVTASLRVIGENRNRYGKELYSRNLARDPVEVLECPNQESELTWLAKSVQARIAEGVPPSEIAVLTRTNLEARGPAQKLAGLSIPCRMNDAVPVLWDHWIARDLLAYLQLGSGRMERADLLRVCNRPNRYITRQSVEAASDAGHGVSLQALAAYYADKDWMGEYLADLKETLTRIGPMRPFAAINYIRRGGGYDAFLQEYARKHRVDAAELTAVADEVQESAAGCDDLAQWKQHIQQARELLEDLRREGRAEREKKPCVTLATLHGAKGLEFSEVYILNVNEGIIPYRRASLEADTEEERRLFYVGMTRAKRRLHLLYVKERFQRKMEPSRFLDCLRTANTEKSERNGGDDGHLSI